MLNGVSVSEPHLVLDGLLEEMYICMYYSTSGGPGGLIWGWGNSTLTPHGLIIPLVLGLEYCWLVESSGEDSGVCEQFLA